MHVEVQFLEKPRTGNGGRRGLATGHHAWTSFV